MRRAVSRDRNKSKRTKISEEDQKPKTFEGGVLWLTWSTATVADVVRDFVDPRALSQIELPP